MKLTKNIKISEGLSYHIKEQINIHQNIFRIGSDEYYSLIKEARSLFLKGFLKTSNPNDQFLFERLQTGTKAKYKPYGKDDWREVSLDDPFILRDDRRKNHRFGVYIDSGEKTDNGEIIAKFIGFSSPDGEIANYDEGRSKSFLARHKCSEKKDKNTPGFWACNVALFHKQLGLKSDNPW